MKPYHSLFMETFIKDAWAAIKSLSALLKKNDISFTIIGGMARNQYKYVRTTEDIDIIVAKKDKEKIKELPVGYIRDISNGRGKRFKLNNPEAVIKIIYEGEISGDGVHGLPFENPSELSKDIKGEPFITLENLIKYKLSSGIYGKRLKDFGDIVELIRANNLPENYADDFRSDLKDKYKELWHNAKEQIDL